MNTTMADGAEQRLDAQIAEALFGQPGMSKMDVANRVRELRGDGPALLGPREMGQAFAQGCDELRMRTGGERAAYLEGVAEGRRAALSAQPSPGGQGDWRAMLSQFGEDDPREGSRSNGHDGVDHNDWVDHAEVPVDVLARIADALAARQPEVK